MSQALEQHQPGQPLGARAGPVARDAAAHRVADQHHARSRQLPDHVIQIDDVIHEVVVAAGADPFAIAMPAEVGRDHVPVWREPLRHRVPGVREIREAVHEHERRRLGARPFEDVVAKTGGELDRRRLHGRGQGPASMWNTRPGFPGPAVVR